MSEMDTAQSLVRSLENISKILAETQSYWAGPLGITVPQWSILTAIAELDGGDGIQLGDVARRLRVDPSFVTAQTKLLEKNGHVLRRQSNEDGRVILLSLTKQAANGLAGIETKRSALNTFIFADFNKDDLAALSSAFSILEKRFQKAPLVLALDA